MKFGWINVFGAVFVLLLIIPNIIYALKNKNIKNLCENKVMNISEQIGRYACIIFMWFPLLICKFYFKSVLEMVLYFLINGLILIAYWVAFAFYLRAKNAFLAITLAVLPTILFLFNGLILRHWLLVASAILFGIAHIYVTSKNN